MNTEDYSLDTRYAREDEDVVSETCVVCEGHKGFDLEDRTFRFAQSVRRFIKSLPKTSCTLEDGKQLIRSSGSVGANYIEANEALSKKDFVMRIKICRKESKESTYWLRLLDLNGDTALERQRDNLTRESTEIMKIFGAIYRKSSQ